MTAKDKPSKGAEKILLAQIKQEFSAPAEAIEQYIDNIINDFIAVWIIILNADLFVLV